MTIYHNSQSDPITVILRSWPSTNAVNTKASLAPQQRDPTQTDSKLTPSILFEGESTYTGESLPRRQNFFSAEKYFVI